jgi:hypothetical protein
MPDPSAPVIERVIAIVIAAGLPLDRAAAGASSETFVTCERMAGRGSGSAVRASGIFIEGMT